MKKRVKQIFAACIIFIFALIVFLKIGEFVWGVNEDNVLLAPDWYVLLLITVSFVLAFFIPRISDIIKREKEKAAQKKEYESLSETEKWEMQKVRFAANLNLDNGLFEKAKKFVMIRQMVNTMDLQREFKIRYSEAAAIMDKLEESGIIEPFSGELNRSVIMRKSAETGLEEVDHMEGHDFEYWCAELLRKNGFVDVEVTQGSGDHGVDVLAVKDGVSYAIQCKCYSHDLGNTPVQEIYAGKEMYGCQVAAVMTNRHFTAGGKALAEKTRVLLWDRDTLIEMLGK